MTLNSVEAIQGEIDRLTPIYNVARRLFAQTKSEVLTLEESIPATTDDVNAWVEGVAARAARLEAANVLVDRLNRDIEKLRKQKQDMIADRAAQEYHALFVEKANLEDEVAHASWQVNIHAKKQRIRQIDNIIRENKYGF